jgi:hypothetical protein
MSRVQNPSGRDRAMNSTSSEMPMTMSGDIIMTKERGVDDLARREAPAVQGHGDERAQDAGAGRGHGRDEQRMQAACMSAALEKSFTYQSRVKPFQAMEKREALKE